MRVLSLLALIPSVVYAAAVQPNANAISPQINGSSVADQLVNAMGLGSIDPRFTIDPEASPDAINSVSAYMNALSILTYLARMDFDGQLPDDKESSCMEPWTDVYVAVMKLGPEPLERRFAIWGLFLSIQYLYKTSFTDTTIDLIYNGQPVGTVLFRLTRPSTLEAAGFNSTNSTITNPNAVASEHDNSSITVLEAVPHTQVSYILNGKDLSPAAVYISLASALVIMAERGSASPMFYIAQRWAELNVWFKLTPERTVVRPAPPPQYMTVGEGIVAVWFTAVYMGRRQPPRYAEYTSLILYNDVRLGTINADYAAGPPAVQKPGSAAAGNGVATT
ncbi:MAG: hypothetical protein OHK93_006897 [Ramalina farinacea]|uniref:Uncharacterized protein n=1 Tax=Ramalina farinacea TaxID=258253 RepID=A0AA43QKV1_9LECA|nr:hypothetical protein [Ramalina farinacea]